MENNIKILPMTMEDLEVIKYDLEEKFDKFWTYGILKSEIANINSRYIVAECKNEIVGFAGFTLIVDEANVMNIVIKKEKRKQGIGSLLLEQLIYIAKELKAATITLEVNSNNVPAINLYKKFNFQEVGLRKKYYNNTDDALIMTKKLIENKRVDIICGI